MTHVCVCIHLECHAPAPENMRLLYVFSENYRRCKRINQLCIHQDLLYRLRQNICECLCICLRMYRIFTNIAHCCVLSLCLCIFFLYAEMTRLGVHLDLFQRLRRKICDQLNLISRKHEYSQSVPLTSLRLRIRIHDIDTSVCTFALFEAPAAEQTPFCDIDFENAH